MRRTPALTLFVAVLVATVAFPIAAQEKSKDGKAAKKDEITLEKLFPEKGLFGPSARSTTFSHDGKHAAWLYRPYAERRHGSDLWVLDTTSGEAKRITSVSVMAEFQKKTRKVRDDRIEKVRKADQKKKTDEDKKGDGAKGDSKKKSGDDKKKEDKGENDGDRVDDKDADAEKAPRYSGISSYVWSPVGDELLFLSGGDIYRCTFGGTKDKGKDAETGPAIERLTKTKDSERSIDYLPDGSGYTFLRDGALYRVRFGSHVVEQIEPSFGSGERLIGYEISPSSERVVLTTMKGEAGLGGASRKVKIARYRDRFMDVREVPRLMADDTLPPQETRHYVYDLGDTLHENGKLREIFKRDRKGPRDIVTYPQWSPNSKRVAFSVFDQETENVTIFEARFEDDPTDDADKKDESDADAKKEKGDDKKEDGAKKDGADKKKDAEDGDDESEKAREIYRFLHFGGPNTPRMIRPYYLDDSQRLAFICEMSGFRQVHVLDPLYQNCEQLTRGRFEIYPIDISKDRKSLFVTATKESPSRLDIYKVSFEDGSMERLTRQDGTYSSVAVSPDGTQVLANYVTYGKLNELTSFEAGKDKLTTLTDSHPEKARELTKATPEMFTYKNRHGHDIHGHWFAPDGFDPKKDKRPLLVYVYGGPLGTRKSVTDGSYRGDSYFFAWYLAKKHGFVTCTIDPRGQSGYGGLFEKANFEQAGKPQVEDLVDGVKWFLGRGGIDPKRVAIHGWSFGGFQTQMCLYTEPEIFAAGIAGAGPTEWENYNAWYTTGTIGESRKGKTDLEKYSLLPLAKNLEGKLLLVHGMEDSNVLYQDTVRVYRELLKAGKETQVELFLDPTGGHGLGGDVKSLNRFRKYEEFLLRTVGSERSDDAKEKNS